MGCALIFGIIQSILQTFANLPPDISGTTSRILSRSSQRSLSITARELHDRYMHREVGSTQAIIRKPEDALAYLALRFPATYAQVYGALSQVAERLPAWQPQSVLDVGCGPGTGIWAAASVWPTLVKAVGVDQVEHFLSIGKEIRYGAARGIDVEWRRESFINWTEEPDDGKKYDLIIVANVINELAGSLKEQVLQRLAKKSSSVIVLIEPGTAAGFTQVQRFAKAFAATEQLIAPYVGNTFVPSDDYWIHFSQRFQRPEFQRAIRQSMRDSSLMASDWEDATYSFVAWGPVPMEKQVWGVCIGKVEKYKGYLMVPVLTREGVSKARVLKRHRDHYNFAKEIRWGQLLETPVDTS